MSKLFIPTVRKPIWRGIEDIAGRVGSSLPPFLCANGVLNLLLRALASYRDVRGLARLEAVCMSIDSHEHNPYAAPLASLDFVEEETEHRRFRWRVVPVTVLYVWGGSLLFVAVLSTVHMLAWLLVRVHRGEVAPIPWAVGIVSGATIVACLGSGLVLSGRSVWKSHWLRGGIGTAASVAAYSAFIASGGRLIGL